MTADDALKKAKIEELYEKLGRLYTKEGQRLWMTRPSRHLDGEKPVDLVNLNGLAGVNRVIAAIEQIETGGL